MPSKPHTCPTCDGKKGGCATCDNTGVVWEPADGPAEVATQHTTGGDPLDLSQDSAVR